MIEYTDMIVETLLKTLVSEGMKGSLNAISSGLRKVFDKGNPEEIKKYIVDQNLVQPTAELARFTIASSYVLPVTILSDAKPQHKVELFAQVATLGFELSKRLKMDIVLPGSVMSPDTISIFSTNDGFPKIKVETLAVSFGAYNDDGSLCVLPAADPVSFCDKVKDKFRTRRLETDAYLSSSQLENFRPFRLEKISAGSVYFNLKASMSKDHAKELGVNEDGLFPLRDWSEGTKRMLRYAAQLPAIESLPAEEAAKLIDVFEELKKFYK
jgi:hypothetical protein